MSPDKQQEIYEERYERKLGKSYAEWLEDAPETEDQAYEKLQEIDQELKQIADILPETTGTERDEMEDERDQLKLEYDLIENMFGLELDD